MPSFDDAQRLDTEGTAVNALSLPLMFALGRLLAGTAVWFVFGFLFRSTYHELGHALTAWLSGRYAFPIPTAFTVVGSPSVAVSVLILAPLALRTGWAVRAERYGLALVLSAFTAIGIDLSFILPERESLTWVTFGGCGGEIILSALVVASFYARPHPNVRWDFWRWPFVLVACCTFVAADHEWREIASDPRRLPHGTATEGSKDSNGDMDKLLRADWTSEQIAGAYVGIGDAAWVGIGALYVIHLAGSLRRGRRPPRAA